jgi:hypothetical protein
MAEGWVLSGELLKAKEGRQSFGTVTLFEVSAVVSGCLAGGSNRCVGIRELICEDLGCTIPSKPMHV